MAQGRHPCRIFFCRQLPSLWVNGFKNIKSWYKQMRQKILWMKILWYEGLANPWGRMFGFWDLGFEFGGDDDDDDDDDDA